MEPRKSETIEKVRSILTDLSEEERRFLAEVIKVERAKLHLGLPRNINDDLWLVLKEIVK